MSNYISNYVLPMVNTPSLIPSSSDMFVKNADDLKNVELCEFLQGMDNEEQRIQILSSEEIATEEERNEYETRIQVGERVIHQIGADILGGIGGAVFGNIFLGPVGSIIGAGSMLGIFNKAVTNRKTARECGMKMGMPRLERLSDKIEQIKDKTLNPDSSTDLKQLNIAEKYLEKNFKYYSNLNAKAVPYVEWGMNGENNSKITTYFDKNGKAYNNGKFTSHTTREIGNTIYHKYETTHFNDGYPKK